MEKYSYIQRGVRHKYACTFFFFLILCLGAAQHVFGQRVYANLSSNDRTGLVVGSVINESLAVDTNINTASNLNITLGLVGVLKQNIRFTNTNKPEGFSPLYIKLNVSIAVLELLDGFSFHKTLGGMNNVVDTTYKKSNISLLGISISLLGSSTPDIIRISPTGNSYDGLQLNIGGVASVISSNFLYGSFFIVAPKIDPVTICSGEKPQLLVQNTSSPNIKYYLYDSETATAAIDSTTTGAFSHLPVLTTGTTTTNKTYYAEAIDNGIYHSAKKSIVVTIRPRPLTPHTEIN